MDSQKNRKELMSLLLKSQPVVLVTTGRTGSDFLQSLLDSHSQVLTFNGDLVGYYAFWKKTKHMRKNVNCMTEDIVYKFVCEHMKQLKSYYDEHERKHMLGSSRNESLIIDINTFVGNVCSLMEGIKLNSKNLLVAIYAAYSEVLGHNLIKKRVLFHHMHHTIELTEFIKDFSNTKIISMTRDPRANYYSGISHRMDWYKNYKLKNKVMTSDAIYKYLERIFVDSYILEKYKCKYTSVRLEDLGRKEILEKISNWIDVEYEDSMMESTWGGLRWGGDELSPKFNKKRGFSSDMINNKWHDKLSWNDKFVLNVVLNSRLKHYGYYYKDLTIIDMLITPFAIVLPTSFEYKAFFNQTMWQFFYNFTKNFYGYGKRVMLFYRYYLKELTGKKFSTTFVFVESKKK
jgi:hypothetical protein